MTTPDHEVIVLYRAAADFSELPREIAKARAAQQALADDERKRNAATIKGEKDTADARRRSSAEAEQQATRQATASKRAAASSEELWRSITRQVDALNAARKAQEAQTRATDADADASRRFTQRQATASTALRGSTEALRGTERAKRDQAAATDADTAAVQRSTTRSGQLSEVLRTLLDTMRNKNRLLREQIQAQDDDSTATRRSTAAGRDMWATISAQVDQLRRSRSGLTEHATALEADSRATDKAQINWRVFTATMREQTAALLANRNGLMARIREGAAAGSGGAPGGGVGREVEELDRSAQRATRSVGRLSLAVLNLRRNGSRGIGGGPGALGEFLAGFAALGDRVGNALQRAGRHVFSFRFLIIALIAALGPVVAVLGSLGAAAIGAGNALISLAGSVAALPGLLFAAATGVGALIVALGPIASALKAYKANQDAITAGGASLADSQRQAADRIRNAQRAYVSASQAVVDAQYEERRSQEALNDARHDALQNLEDLRRELARSALNEESAVLSLKEAQDAYLRTLADPNADALERERALLRIKEAEFDLGDVRVRNARLAEEAADAEARGVEGSREVIDARRQAELATRNVADAVLRLEDATRDLADAQHQQATGGGASARTANALAAALAKLSPSARAVALGLIGMADAWRKIQLNVQEAFFRPLVGQLGNLRSLLPVVSTLLTTAAAALGDVAARGIEMVSSGPWKADFGTLAASNSRILTRLGNAGLLVADAFRHIAVAAAPFTEWVAGAVERTAAGFRDWAKSARESGEITRFLETTADRFSQVWRIIKNVGAAIWSLFGASESFTSWFLDRVEAVTKKWRDWAKAQEDATSPFRQWLEDVKPLLSEVARLIGGVITTFGGMASDTRNMQEAQRILKTLADEILPTIQTIFGELSESGALSTLVETLSTLLQAVSDFLTAGGGGALAGFVNSLLFVAQFFAAVMENDQAAAVITGVATALGLLAGAAAIGRFTGLFALANLLRTLYVRALLLRGVGIGGILAGAGGTAAGGAAGGGGLVGRVLGAFAEPGSSITRPLYVFVVNDLPGAPGVPGTPGAPGARPVGVLGGLARVAAPVAAAAIVIDSATKLINEPEARKDPQNFTSLVSPITGTTETLLSWIGQNIIAPLAPEGSRLSNPDEFSKDKFVVNQEDWDNLGRFIEDDVFEPTKGFFYDLGFKIGDAAKSAAGWVHDYILVPAGEWFNGIRTSITDTIADTATWAHDNLVQPALDWLAPFGDIFRGIKESAVFYASQAGQWVYDNVVAPFLNFLYTARATVSFYATQAGVWIQNNVIAPFINFFSNIGRWISSAASSAGAWVQNNIINPAVNFFVGIGRAIVSIGPAAGQWIQNYIVNPVVNFFSAIGRFIANIPGRIRQWAESLPIIGPFVRAQGLQSGGLIGGRRDGVIDGVPLWATVGEFMIRKRVVDKPGGKDLLTALNEERIDPAALYAALDIVAQQVNIPLQVPAGVRGPTTNIVENTRNAGMSFGDVIINNPAVERASTSLRRSLQTLAYMSDR